MPLINRELSNKVVICTRKINMNIKPRNYIMKYISLEYGFLLPNKTGISYIYIYIYVCVYSYTDTLRDKYKK